MSNRRIWKSSRITDLQQSEIRRMTRECDRFDAINLGQGVCDLPTPESVLTAASHAVLKDKSTYSKPEGAPELRKAIAEKVRDYNGLKHADPETDVVVTIGATGAFNCAIHALLEPGSEVLVFEPYYGYHVNSLMVGGFKPVFVTLEPPGWQLTWETIEAAVTPRTRAIVVNTPVNPSGKVMTGDELAIIAGICERYDLLALTDEIYEYILFDGHEHVSLASLPGMWERTVTISGFSKTFSITGWRLGYAIAHPEISERITLVNDLMYVCAPTPLQHGVADAMHGELDDSYYSEMAVDYLKKRDMFCDALAAAGLTPYRPSGAYYVLADITRLGCADDRAAAMLLLEEVGVASIPGSAFYASDVGKTLVRFCFAKDWPTLEEACRRLRRL